MAKRASIFLIVKRILIVILCPLLAATSKIQKSPAANRNPVIRQQIQELEQIVGRHVHGLAIGRRVRLYAENKSNINEIVGIIYITDGSRFAEEPKKGVPLFPEQWPAGIYILRQSQLPYRTSTVVDDSCTTFNVRYDIKTRKLLDFPSKC